MRAVVTGETRSTSTSSATCSSTPGRRGPGAASSAVVLDVPGHSPGHIALRPALALFGHGPPLRDPDRLARVATG